MPDQVVQIENIWRLVIERLFSFLPRHFGLLLGCLNRRFFRWQQIEIFTKYDVNLKLLWPELSTSRNSFQLLGQKTKNPLIESKDSVYFGLDRVRPDHILQNQTR